MSKGTGHSIYNPAGTPHATGGTAFYTKRHAITVFRLKEGRVIDDPWQRAHAMAVVRTWLWRKYGDIAKRGGEVLIPDLSDVGFGQVMDEEDESNYLVVEFTVLADVPPEWVCMVTTDIKQRVQSIAQRELFALFQQQPTEPLSEAVSVPGAGDALN
jgi:hypothetical protein